MAAVIDASVGGVASNSYETLAESGVYFDERLPLATPWVASGDTSNRALIMATRVLDAMAVAHKTLRFGAGGAQYIYVSREWTGTPATATQRLAWPRVGMFDRLGRALNFTATAISVASPTVVTFSVDHRLVTGQKVLVADSDSTPSLDGEQTVTVLTTKTVSIAVNVTVAGTTAAVYVIPRELKDAESELAGQLIMADTTLDNAVLSGGIKSVSAGSVSVSFKDDLLAHVLPDFVLSLMPESWFTEEVIAPAQRASFDVIS